MVPLEVEGDLFLGGLCAQTVGLVLSWLGIICKFGRRRCRRRDLEGRWIGWFSQRRGGGGCEVRPLRMSSKNVVGMSSTVFTFPCVSGV
jgi:hypothetical protein